MTWKNLKNIMKISIKRILFKTTRIIPKFKKKFYIKWNRIKFSLAGIEYGENLNVFNSIYIYVHDHATVTIGKNFKFSSGAGHNPISRNIKGCIHVPENAQLHIGDNVGISSASIRVKEKITIGNNVLIGSDCILLDTDSHNLDYRIRRSKEKIKKQSLDTYTAATAPITIEDDVLIGTRCIILKGVTIGARSVIGSGSVVTKNIPADCIAAGNPCKILKKINATE